ncbi:fucolectin-like [Discoglossus pictus]
MVGRYVNIVIPGRWEYLHVCEVQVIGLSGAVFFRRMSFLLTLALMWLLSCDAASIAQDKNVALQGRATQSSLWGWLYAMNAIDGNQDPNKHHGSCSHTHHNYAPWWRVDLLKCHRISQIIITNRGDCCGERLNGAEILIGNSLSNNGNNNPRCARISSIPKGATQTYQCHDMVGRYVNIVIPGRWEYLHICEVQVIGVSVD